MSSGSSKKSREETLLPSSAPLFHPIPIPSLLPPSTLPLPPIREEHPLDEVATLSNNETTTCTTIPPPATFVPHQSQGDVTVRAACRPHPFSAGSQNASLFPSSSMTTANTTTTPLSEDELIFQKVDLKLKESLDKFFKIQSGKGERKPPATYVGFSRDFRECFQKIRDWRTKSKEEQEEEISKYRALSTGERRKLQKNINYLMKQNKSTRLPAQSPVPQPLACITNTNAANTDQDKTITGSKKRKGVAASAIQKSTMRCLQLQNLKRAKEGNSDRLKHIGIASTLEERLEKINLMKEASKKGNEWRKRSNGQRPQYAYQAGDATGRKALNQTIKYFGKFSDSVTLRREKQKFGDSDDKEDDMKPRNAALMMVMSEVAASSTSGGGPREKGVSRREKPEFLLVSDNMKDCKRIVTAFSEILTSDAASNKKNNFEWKWLHQDEKSGLLSTSIESFIAEEASTRASGRNQRVVTLEQMQEEEVDKDFGSLLE